MQWLEGAMKRLWFSNTLLKHRRHFVTHKVLFNICAQEGLESLRTCGKCCEVVAVWFGLGMKTTWQGLGKDCWLLVSLLRSLSFGFTKPPLLYAPSTMFPTSVSYSSGWVYIGVSGASHTTETQSYLVHLYRNLNGPDSHDKSAHF